MKLDLFGRKISVKLKKSSDADLADCIGFCDMKKNLIVLQSDLPAKVKLQILFHEMWHAVFQNDSEDWVDTHSLIMFEFLYENGMIRWPKK